MMCSVSTCVVGRGDARDPQRLYGRVSIRRMAGVVSAVEEMDGGRVKYCSLAQKSLSHGAD